MTGPSPAERAAPPTVVSVITSVATGLVVYFALHILLAAPGNVLALVCLVLVGLTTGNVIRRSGLRSLAAGLIAGAIVMAVLLAFTVGR